MVVTASLAASARVHQTRVLDRTPLADGVVLLGLLAPEIAKASVPGQFAMAIPPRGESAAVALGIYEAAGDRLSLLFFVIGNRTAQLSNLRPGDELAVTGPLGNGFFLDDAPGDVAIVAGGVGIASVLLPAQRLIRDGKRVRLYYGARSRDLLVEAQRFADEGCEVELATDDGSAGRRGDVTQLLAESKHKPGLILACGPSPMLRATAAVARELGVRAQLSLEETFACGLGGCWGCTVPLSRESAQAPGFPAISGTDAVNARVCKEGPVFWAHELRW